VPDTRFFLYIALLSGVAWCAPKDAAPAASQWPAFASHLATYVDLHKRLESLLPPVKNPADTAEVAEHRKALGEAIRSARGDARPGDVLTPDVRPAITHIVHSEFQATTVKHNHHRLMDNPTLNPAPLKLNLKIDAPYPDDAPLANLPPTLMPRLPKLPPVLEYRFVGRDLIIRDVSADLIVDYMRDVLQRF
jgi:hypothetical protein